MYVKHAASTEQTKSHTQAESHRKGGKCPATVSLCGWHLVNVQRHLHDNSGPTARTLALQNKTHKQLFVLPRLQFIQSGKAELCLLQFGDLWHSRTQTSFQKKCKIKKAHRGMIGTMFKPCLVSLFNIIVNHLPKKHQNQEIWRPFSSVVVFCDQD